jgi:hypothetical protein
MAHRFESGQSGRSNTVQEEEPRSTVDLVAFSDAAWWLFSTDETSRCPRSSSGSISASGT